MRALVLVALLALAPSTSLAADHLLVAGGGQIVASRSAPATPCGALDELDDELACRAETGDASCSSRAAARLLVLDENEDDGADGALELVSPCGGLVTATCYGWRFEELVCFANDLFGTIGSDGRLDIEAAAPWETTLRYSGRILRRDATLPALPTLPDAP